VALWHEEDSGEGRGVRAGRQEGLSSAAGEDLF